MSRITEVAPDVYRISTYISTANLQFNQFLVKDEQSLLFHTGMIGLFPAVMEAITRLVDPAEIRWIAFSHFEADECGALREWQTVAPKATAVCSAVAKLVSVDDVVAARPAQALADGELLTTGKYRFRFLRTPHVPHAWDAGHLFEETHGTLFCSDLFHQNGEREDVTRSEIVSQFRETLIEYQQGPFADYLPYTTKTRLFLERLADLKPKTLAAMHGSTYVGDGQAAIRNLAQVIEELLGAG